MPQKLEETPPFGAPRRDRSGADTDAAERPRTVQERLEAAVSGLGELDLLRRRQEELVRTALEIQEEAAAERRDERLSAEEKLLEENILLLRKQLNCLRRRDAGLIWQLQELDRQISDLRLDNDASHDKPEPDSRPSSGFYELSDAASGSLSNSSNSVFSECLCSTADIEGRLLSADPDESGCLDCDGLLGGLCDASFSCNISRSMSAPHSGSLDPGSSPDPRTKYHCDLWASNSSDVFRYPSPLHAVAVHTSSFRLSWNLRGGESVETLKAETDSLASLSCSSCQTPSHKHLEGYIYTLLQRRVQPIRTNRPRTSISTDPVKSLLRPGKQPSCSSRSGAAREPEPKSSWMEQVVSPQFLVDERPEDQEVLNGSLGEMQHRPIMNCSDRLQNQNGPYQTGSSFVHSNSNSLLKKKSQGAHRELSVPRANTSPKEPKQPYFFQDQEPSLISPFTPQPQLVQTGQADRGPQTVLDPAGIPSCQSQKDGGHKVPEILSEKRQTKLCKGDVQSVGVKNWGSEYRKPERGVDKHRPSCKKSCISEDGVSARLKISRRAGGGRGGHGAPRIKRLPASIPEDNVLDRHAMEISKQNHRGSHSHHHTPSHHRHRPHHRGREQVVVVAKPKHKRNDYRRLRGSAEVSHEEVFKRLQGRQRKERLSPSAARGHPLASPYMAGSDSEYSAECVSLFHSTIVDTSEDEKSNYTTNCFGDSECGEDEEENTASSDTEESGGGGAGLGQPGASGPKKAQWNMTPQQAKTFVKIKASHNLKRKILRFRSGSLKLMTTV